MKKTFILLVTMLLSIGAFAQFSERSRLGCVNGTQALLPTGSSTYVGAYYYVYMQNSTPQGSFSQVERSSNLTLKTINLDTGYIVTDFVIYNGKIYFTGDHNNATGYVGWFDINEVFNGNGTIHYYQFKYTSIFPPVINYYYYRNFQKIKVFSDGTNIHTLVLGSRYYILSGERKYCIMDYQPGSSSFTFAYNANLTEHYDDIAITNSAVVIAARKGIDDVGNVFMRMFPRLSFSLGNSIGQTLYYYTDNHALYNIHLQSTSSSSDTFFVVYYSNQCDTCSPYFQGLRVNCCYASTIYGIVHNNPSIIVNNQGTTLSSACKIWGTAYSPQYRRLLVLQNMDAPISPNTTVSAVCRFLHSSSGVSFDRVVYRNGLLYNSIATYSTYNWITCGLQNQQANILIEDWGNIGTFTCATHNTSLTTNEEHLRMSYDTYNLTTGTNRVTHRTSTPTVIPSIYMEDCLQQLIK